MKIWLLRKGGRVRLFPASDYASAKVPCPACAAEPLKVQGTGRHPSKDDRAWEAEGFCVACRAHVGTIRAEMDTLFGVEEDEAVLVHGRARVY